MACGIVWADLMDVVDHIKAVLRANLQLKYFARKTPSHCDLEVLSTNQSQE